MDIINFKWFYSTWRSKIRQTKEINNLYSSLVSICLNAFYQILYFLSQWSKVEITFSILNRWIGNVFYQTKIHITSKTICSSILSLSYIFRYQHIKWLFFFYSINQLNGQFNKFKIEQNSISNYYLQICIIF